MIVSLLKYIQCSLVCWRLDSVPTPSLVLNNFFHLPYPVQFFQSDGEHSVFNSFRPYSTKFSFPPLHMAHSVDPTLKYLPGSLSLLKGSCYLNTGWYFMSLDRQRLRQGLLSCHRPATLWYSGSSIVTWASLHPSMAACEGLFLPGKCLCDKCAAWNNSWE